MITFLNSITSPFATGVKLPLSIDIFYSKQSLFQRKTYSMHKENKENKYQTTD